MMINRQKRNVAMADKFLIPTDHPSLQGHFPGNPIVPGVVILNEVVRLIEQKITSRAIVGIRSVKFIKPLRPGGEVVLFVDQNDSDVLNIVCEHNGDVLVKGQLVLSSKDAA